MNIRSRFGFISLALSVLLLVSSFMATRQVQANARVNDGIGIFHDALAPYGNWVNHRTYGQVWYPRGVAYGWRPYTDGYWAHTYEYDLPRRHINSRIFAPQMNPRIITVTNHINSVTIINNTIVNQGVPVKQIEALTGKPVESVAPTVLNQVDVNTLEHNEGQPNIIQLPIAAPTPEEIHHNEELARRLDGKNPDGTRTELLSIVNPERSNHHKPRVPGRLAGEAAPVQSPYATPEQQNPVLTEPTGQTLPLPGIPETPLVGLGLDSESKHKETKSGRMQKERVIAQPQVDAAPVPPMQTEMQQEPEPARRKDEQKLQKMDMQPQQTEITREETRQQELQDQQQQQHEAGSQDNRAERRGHKRGIE